MPSPLAHMISGSIIGGAILFKDKEKNINKKFWLILGCALIASSPDLDMLMVYLGWDYYEVHRTYTHSIISVCLIVTFLYSINKIYSINIPYKIVCICLLVHIGMDLVTEDLMGPQGIMLLWPVSNDFFYPGINLFLSPFDHQGEIISLSGLIIIAIREAIVTCGLGLLLFQFCWKPLYIKS